jgi:hypothetical protein
MNVSIGDLASIVGKPSDLLPVLLLILQEDSFVLEILSNLHDYVGGSVYFASNIE